MVFMQPVYIRLEIYFSLLILLVVHLNTFTLSQNNGDSLHSGFEKQEKIQGTAMTQLAGKNSYLL